MPIEHLWRRPRIIITSFPVRDSIENYEPDRAPNSGREEPRVDQFMDKVFKTFQGAAWDESWLIPNRIISAALQYNDEPFFRGYTIASLFNLKVGDLVSSTWKFSYRELGLLLHKDNGSRPTMGGVPGNHNN